MTHLRYRLIGPKVQVTEVERGLEGMKIKMRLGSVSILWDAPIPNADVRVGDYLTLYTEVLVNEHSGSSELN